MDQPPSATPSRDLSGRDVGGYCVLRRLGSGGMADVYLAEQQSLGRQVALKVLHARLADDANYVTRFSNEARAAASLVHPGIVQIYEVGQADGIHFIAQEYVAGKNLSQVLEREGALGPGLVLDILRQVVSALCKAHELGIVHRDIKPENILFGHSGEVKVADFGLARVLAGDTKTLTQVGVAMGTPLYMSPEQIEGRPVDVRSDIYSLGVTCYHLLSGEPPHTGETALAIAVQHINTTPVLLGDACADVPSALARLVHRMLSKKPQDRPSTPNALLADLRELASEAAAEGWAEGPDHWSLVERVATEGTRSRTNEQLAQLMRAEAKLDTGHWKWGRLLLGAAAALILGLALGAVTRPKFYLAGRESPQVLVRSSAAAQLYHAKMVGGEAAWIAAAEFEGADPFHVQLAKQGLIRHYLLVAQEYHKAISVLRELDQISRSNGSLESVQAFTQAGLYICHQQLGHKSKAQEAHDQLSPDRHDLLRNTERELYEKLQNSLRRSND